MLKPTRRLGAGRRRGTAYYDPSLLRPDLAMSTDLAQAMNAARLRLHYQAIQSLHTGYMTGFEALARWQHGECDISPAIFIPVAEQSDLIHTLGTWVVHESFQALSAWPSELTISINISPRQLGCGRLLPVLLEALAHTGVAPARVVLEITETTSIEEDEAVVAELLRMRQIGFRIAFDDFGTGYAGLRNVLRFPADVIKIDRSFVENVESDQSSRAIVDGICTMAKHLGARVVAEGVETREQMGILRDLGCDDAQGFLIGRPAPEEIALALLRPKVVLMPSEQ